jgi:two-component system, NtrC family, sensor kinase
MSDSKTNATVSEPRILVVDSDRNAADSLEKLLSAVPYDVVVCANDTDAFDAIANRPVDVVLLDMEIPGGDGFTIAKRMKERFGANNFVPVILLSSSSGRDKMFEGLAFADDFIVKPFHQDELLARIRVMLRIRRQQSDMAPDATLEHEQKIARAQLYRSARLASIGTFASGVAHELNNPLTAVLGFSGSLLERMNRDEKIDKDELEQYLTIINSETVRCSEIVENLSQFAREGEVQIGDFTLVECVDGAVMLVNSLAARKGVAIAKTVPADILVRADIRKLQQAIVYIVTNSLDFCKSGSTIVIGAVLEGSSVKLSIRDNGPGIAPEMLPKVFDPFFTTKEVGQGMGMGLAMCYVIMEECNGGIDVNSEKGKGTTVILDIPAAL